MELLDREKTWDIKPEFKIVTQERPAQKSTAVDFLQWCYINILQRVPDDEGMNTWMEQLKKGMPAIDIERHFRGLVAQDNRFEEIRWTKSLQYRGIETPVANIDFAKDFVPGMLV